MGVKSKTFFKETRRVFTFSEMHAHIARLAVLYEDLRIETAGIMEDSLPGLDYSSKEYRVNYFLRRVIATLIEVADSLRKLNEDPEFQQIRTIFDPEQLQKWKVATEFFQQFELILKLVRNDIGGHFGYKAARFAIENIDSSIVGQFELCNEGPSKVGVKLHFAGDIAVTAMARHKGEESAEDFVMRILRIVGDGNGHAITAIDTINAQYLLDRFK